MDWKLELVVVPVADVDRAKHFYSEQVGFLVDHDTRVNEDTRVVQLTPPEPSSSSEVLRSARSSTSTRVAELMDAGGDWNSLVFFNDPDGNGWAVQERPTRH